MEQFINSFGKNNLMVVLAIVVAIVLALIIIVIIEKVQSKKQSIKNYEYEEEVPVVKQKAPMKEEKKKEELLETKETPKEMNEPKQEIKEEPVISNEKPEVVYKEEVGQIDAKKKLTEAAEKLVKEPAKGTDGHTHFEEEQEESSIISYEELKKASKEIDDRNDNLLQEEESYPITIEELYKKHVEEQDEIKELDNPIFEDDLPKKFKNSEVISPVFGVYKRVDEPKTYTNASYERNMSKREIDHEIRKTEDFLTELRSLKNKLD